MTIYSKILKVASVVVLAATFSVPSAFAEDAVCPLTKNIKQSAEYCAAKGLIPGTKYGCVVEKTKQQVTCNTLKPRPYVAPVVEYRIETEQYTVQRCPNGSAPELQTSGLYVCATSVSYSVAPQTTVRQAAYTAPVTTKPTCTYCKLQFAGLNNGRVPVSRYSSDDRYETTTKGVVGLAKAGATAWGYDRIASGIAKSGSSIVNNNTVNNHGETVPTTPNVLPDHVGLPTALPNVAPATTPNVLPDHVGLPLAG